MPYQSKKNPFSMHLLEVNNAFLLVSDLKPEHPYAVINPHTVLVMLLGILLTFKYCP